MGYARSSTPNTMLGTYILLAVAASAEQLVSSSSALPIPTAPIISSDVLAGTILGSIGFCVLVGVLSHLYSRRSRALLRSAVLTQGPTLV
jgi:hypothetical protein